MSVSTVIIDLSISSEEYLKWYRGQARSVSAVSRCGQRVSFPVDSLRPFISHEGVSGSFEIAFDVSVVPNKLCSIKRL